MKDADKGGTLEPRAGIIVEIYIYRRLALQSVKSEAAPCVSAQVEKRVGDIQLLVQ